MQHFTRCDNIPIDHSLSRRWIGDGRAVSSMHKDHYENVMCVVRGTKVCVSLIKLITHVQYSEHLRTHSLGINTVTLSV